jgi:hypothetical protein
LLFIIGLKIFGQVKPLNVDKYVSVNLPGEVVKFDTLVNNLPVIQLYSNVNNTVYSVSKFKINKEKDFKGLPYDEESLYEVYNGAIKGVLEGMGDRDFESIDTSKIMIEKFKGSLLTAKTDKGKTVEAKLVLLGECLYMVSYVNFVDFNEKDKDAFLSSMVINPQSPSQFLGNKPGFEMSKVLWKILLAIFTVFILRFLSRKLKQNKKEAEVRVKSDV